MFSSPHWAQRSLILVESRTQPCFGSHGDAGIWASGPQEPVGRMEIGTGGGSEVREGVTIRRVSNGKKYRHLACSQFPSRK